MSDRQRLESGCKPIICAGIDCALSRSHCTLAKYECIQEIKSGMHAYAMALGSPQQYAEYARVDNVISSLKHIHTLPTREYYSNNEDHAADLAYAITGKAKCLQHAWSIISQDQPPGSANILQALCRIKLYESITIATDNRLINVIQQVVHPMGFDALRVTWATEKGLDDAWLKSCKWPARSMRYMKYRSKVVEALCISNRTDILKWMLDNSPRVDYTSEILCRLSNTSVDLVKQLVDVKSIGGNDLQHLYVGAFSNPDASCLDYLVRQGVNPPHNLQTSVRWHSLPKSPT